MATEHTALHLIALGLNAKKNFIKAGIEADVASALADVNTWDGEVNDALVAFVAAYQNAQSTRNTEVLAALNEAQTSIIAYADLILESDDGILNDLKALDKKISEDHKAFESDILAKEALLLAKRDVVDERIGKVEDYSSSYATPTTPTTLISDTGTMRMIVSIPKEFTLGDLQSSLDPSYEGDDSNASWGYLTLPEGVTDIAGAKAHFHISNDSFILEDNFADMKGYVEAAEEGTYEEEEFEFAPHQQMGLPNPTPGNITTWYWTHKAAQKFSVAVIHSVSSDSTSPFGDITPEKEIFLTGTAAVKGADKNLHNVDLSSIPNAFHHIAIDVDHITPSLVEGTPVLKKMFFKSDSEESTWASNSIELGTDLFKEYLSANGHIYPLQASHYVESIHNLKTKYGTFMHNFYNDSTFQNGTWTIAEAFGWDMSTFISNNGDLYNFFTNTLKASKQLMQDYSYHANPINGDSIIFRSTVNAYESTDDINKAMDIVSKIKSDSSIAFGNDMDDDQSFITYLANEEEAAQFAMTWLTIERVTQRVNSWQSNKLAKLMNWNSAFQSIEISENFDWKGHTKVIFNTSELENNPTHHAPVIAGFEADGAVDFFATAEDNAPHVVFQPNGTGPFNGSYHVAGPIVEGDTTYWVQRNNYTQWSPRLNPVWMKSTGEGNVQNYQNDSSNHIAALVWDKTNVTLESMASFKAYLQTQNSNLSETSPYVSFYNAIDTEEEYIEFNNELNNSGLAPTIKWTQKIGNNAMYDYFSAGTQLSPQYGNGMRDLATGEEITGANALNFIGFSTSPYSMTFMAIYGKNGSQAHWNPRLEHFASDFVPSYQEGMNVASLENNVIFLGTYSNYTHMQLKGYLGNIVKDFNYDDSYFGKISNEVSPTDEFYISNAPYNTDGLLELDNEGNYTSVDMTSDEFIAGDYYRIDYNLQNTIYDIPQITSDWLDSMHDSSRIEYKKFGKDTNGKVFPMYSRIATKHIKEDNKFKPKFLDDQINGVAMMNALYGGGSQNFLRNYLSQTTGLFSGTNIQIVDKFDKINANEITFNFPAWNGLEAVSYTKPKGYDIMFNNGNNNGNYKWSDDMLPMFEYLHKAMRMLVKGQVSSGTDLHSVNIPEIPVEEWRAKVLSEGASWDKYIYSSLDNTDGVPNFATTQHMIFGDPMVHALAKFQSMYSANTNALYWSNNYYQFLYGIKGSLTSHHELTLNDDGSVVVDIIEPFLINVVKEKDSSNSLPAPITFRIKGIEENPTGETMAFPGYGDCTEVEPKWDLELYTGHLSLLNDSLHPDALTDSDHSINDIINGSGSYSDLAITEIGGDGLYTTSLTSINGYTGATKTNRLLPGDIDSDGDGLGDLSDLYPQDAKDAFDNDQDGIGNNQDLFPFSPTAHWSILEDRDGNQYKTPGSLVARGWAADTTKIVETPPHINLAEAGYDDSIYVASNDNDVEDLLMLLTYVSSQVSEPELPTINLNKVSGGADSFIDGNEVEMFAGVYHIKASDITTSHEPMSHIVTADYSYSNQSIAISEYADKFANGTITFEEIDAYFIALENVTTKDIRYRFFDSYGDGGLNINYPVEIKDEAGNVIDSITFHNQNGWSLDNNPITHANGTIHNYWTMTNKKVWKSEIIALNPGNYTLNFTSDYYSNSETSVLIMNVAGNGDETPFTGGGNHAGSYNTYGSLTSNTAHALPFTVA